MTTETRIPLPPITRGTLTTPELARLLGVSPSWVTGHADELAADLGTRPIRVARGGLLWPIADLQARGVIVVAEEEVAS